jgi:hypothetical protein
VSYAENIGLISNKHVQLSALTAHLRPNLGPIVTGLGESVTTSEYYWRHFLGDIQQSLTGRRGKHPVLTLVPILCFSALVIAGLVILAVRRAWLMLFIPVFSIGLMWITPWPEQFLRYLMPLSPFLAIAALLPLSELRASPPIRPDIIGPARAVLGGFLLLALILQTYAVWQLFHRWRDRPTSAGANLAGRSRASYDYFYYTRPWQSWEEGVAWITANTPPDAIIATPHQHLCYLRSNRRTVLPPLEPDPTRARRLLEAVPVSYVVVTDAGENAEVAWISSRYSLPAVQEDPGNWSLVFSNDRTQIYSRAIGQK